MNDSATPAAGGGIPPVTGEARVQDAHASQGDWQFHHVRLPAKPHHGSRRPTMPSPMDLPIRK